MQKIEVLTGEEVLITRTLWEEVFHEDSEAFTEYYFIHKAKENICFVIKDAGEIVSMVHLTPYELCVTQDDAYITSGDVREIWRHVGVDCKRGMTDETTSDNDVIEAVKACHTYYIVGVATKRQYRHKGYMTQLLETAFRYMKENGILFTFLMPANPKIYEPFGFRYIYERTDYHMNPGFANILRLQDIGPIVIRNRSVSIKKAEEKDCDLLSAFAMKQLQKKYNFFLRRNTSYYSRLIYELKSQNGGIYIVYVEENFAGYFLGAKEQDIFIQEVLLKEEFEPLLLGDDSSFLEPGKIKKPIIMGKYLGDSQSEDCLLKRIAEGKVHGGFINEIV